MRDGRAAVPSYKGIHKLKFIAFTICRGTISTPHPAKNFNEMEGQRFPHTVVSLTVRPLSWHYFHASFLKVSFYEMEGQQFLHRSVSFSVNPTAWRCFHASSRKIDYYYKQKKIFVNISTRI